MVEAVQKIHKTTLQDGDTVETTKTISDPEHEAMHSQNVAARTVWFIAGALLIVLGFRFLLSLLGANAANAFANFIYSVSYPFVAPFFSLFGYNFKYGVAHFEMYTLVAMLVYTVIAYGIARLVTINRDY